MLFRPDPMRSRYEPSLVSPTRCLRDERARAAEKNAEVPTANNRQGLQDELQAISQTGNAAARWAEMEPLRETEELERQAAHLQDKRQGRAPKSGGHLSIFALNQHMKCWDEWYQNGDHAMNEEQTEGGPSAPEWHHCPIPEIGAVQVIQTVV